MYKKVLLILIFFIEVVFIQHSYAGQREFDLGFEEGYKCIKGDMVIVPITPIAPITPIGSTDFREGLKAGIRAAKGTSDNNSYSNPYQYDNGLNNLNKQYQDLLKSQQQMLEQLASLPIQINLKNETNVTIWTAISYLDVNSQWQTQGWWKLKPEEEVFVAQTNNAIFYTYAKSDDGNLIWSGSDTYDYIRDSKEKYGFTKCQIERKVAKFTYSFTVGK